MINIAAIATLAGGATSAWGQYQAGRVQRQIAEYNARQLDEESRILGLEAKETLRRRRKENERILGTQKARIAASGIAMGTGSALDAMAENAALLEMEALDEQRNIRNQRRSLWAQARTTVLEGRYASRAGKIGAMGTLLGAAGRSYSMYDRTRTSNAPEPRKSNG